MQIAANDDWQGACRTYATGFTESVIAAGALADRLRPGDALQTRFLETTEVLLGALTRAGFDDETAVRSLALLTAICTAFARDVVFASRHGARPRPLLLRSALAARDPGAYENLSRIAANPVDTYDRRQLEHSVEVFLRGTEALRRGNRRDDAQA